MAKLTKAGGRRRLKEAEAKFKKVYMSSNLSLVRAVKTADMEAISKIVDRCINRIR